MAASNEARYFRGTGAYHHVLGLHGGTQPAVVRIAFDVADRAGVDALHEKISAAGAQARQASETDRRPVAATALPARTPTAATSLLSPIAPTMPTRADIADRPRKIVHVNLNTVDFDGTLNFSPRRSAFASSTIMRRCGSCIATIPIIARSCCAS